ncbi:hypothetical protein P0082_12335 [Candidatus Haliotispira prima]|uniref:BPL/LPL catalytic domain-containing protein n=1 Tax=Candidatus Haliotispira prima TaxID=3034016 RepID=A0ABY8MGZ0_9SPIO|nr:hypothetical protein P0082_12335 [Candidatus Haliotispira prima]
MTDIQFFGTTQEFREVAARSPAWRSISEDRRAAASEEFRHHNGVRKAAIFARCNSTFDVLRELEEQQGFSCWDWVMACYQEQGRGQYGRQWQSPLGNLCVSQLLPDFPGSGEGLARQSLSEYRNLLPMLVVGVIVGVLQDCGYPVLLKWPNDIVLAGRIPGKAGGLLLEHRNGSLALGLGLNFAPVQEFSHLQKANLQETNLNGPGQANADLPVLPIVSLPWPPDNQDSQFSLPDLWQLCSDELRRAWQRWLQLDGPSLHRQVENILAFRGEMVQFFEFETFSEADSNQTPRVRCTHGCLHGLGAHGELILETPTGFQHKLRGSLRPIDS